MKWTVTPEKEGQHALVLDVREMLLLASSRANDQLTTEFLLNGTQTPMRDEGVVDLPVVITTLRARCKGKLVMHGQDCESEPDPSFEPDRSQGASPACSTLNGNVGHQAETNFPRSYDGLKAHI